MRLNSCKWPHDYLHGDPYFEHVCKWINVNENVSSITMHVNGLVIIWVEYSNHMWIHEASGLFISTQGKR
jgi:hypothetical protein